MEKNKDAEKDIINAARKIFYNKGFKETTMRDIAAEANTNLALVNYYFRSKENLFYIIYDESIMIFFNKLLTCFEKKDTDVKEKIKSIISEYLDFFIGNPHIPNFIMGEVIRNPQSVSSRINENLKKNNILMVFEQQIQNEIKAGLIKPVSAISIFMNILSLVLFPIISKPIMQEAFHLTPSQFNDFIVSRKQEITDIIINSIKT